MDRTHYRFFDWHTAQELVSSAGFRICSVSGDGGFPLSRLLPFARTTIDRLVMSMAPSLFSWQFVITAERNAQ
jgi:hypothetical protein